MSLATGRRSEGFDFVVSIRRNFGFAWNPYYCSITALKVQFRMVAMTPNSNLPAIVGWTKTSAIDGASPVAGGCSEPAGQASSLPDRGPQSFGFGGPSPR